MKFTKYLKDKMYATIIFVFLYLVFLLLFLAFKVKIELIIVASCLLIFTFVLLLAIEYARKKKFYDELFSRIESLDKSYLVLEMLDEPCFYEGELLWQAMYLVNKSMAENVKNYENQMNDFKEYIEMWIHEVKIPISSLTLMAHNHKSKYDKRTMLEMKKIEDYVEQVLYYARQDCAERDYLIKRMSLSKVLSNVILKNKDEFLENDIELSVEKGDHQVYTDSKWLEFIINQIINNSIKYKKDINSYIKIDASEDENYVKLVILDNGIGISKSDLPRVFDKSFTGSNGRASSKSTGMGLYIVKNLCKRLGHEIEIESVKDEFTKVIITFSKNKFYEEVQ